jgi:hypothetical protein
LESAQNLVPRLTGRDGQRRILQNPYRIDRQEDRKEEEMKKPARKLEVSRETLHNLALTAVSGGILTAPYTHCLCSVKVCHPRPALR